MAVIQWSALLNSMKGKVRGDTFQFTSGGQVVRSTGRGRPVPTQRQQVKRLNVAQVTGSWQGLSATNRAAWAAMAPSYPTKDRFGNSRTPTGYNLFCKLNLNLMSAGQTTLSVPASPVAITDISTSAIYSTTTNGWAFKMNVAQQTNELLLISASRQTTPGRANPINGYSSIYAPTTWVNGQIFGISSYYNATFGNEVKGGQIFLKLQVLNKSTGQTGVPVLLSFVTT